MNIFNSFPHNKILDLSKFKAFADDKINVTKKMKFVLGRVKTLWEKEKMLVASIFSFSLNVFKRLLSLGRYKLGLCGKELRRLLETLWEKGYGGKHSDQRRKCWLPSISFFPTMISKAFSFRVGIVR